MGLPKRIAARIALGALAAAGVIGLQAHEARAENTPQVKDYFDQFEASGLVDIDSGSKDTLIIELRRAEGLLRSGAYEEAAVALYSIVESPRYEGFEDFVEFQNSQYYLGVALTRSGSYEAAMVYFLQTMTPGPSTLYFAPAHRQAVDIALKTRRSAEILAQLEALKLNEPVPPGVSGERAYLRARAAYEKDNFAGAEAELVKISRKSRMYSSALYLRGVIRTRKGEFTDAAESFCEISATPDDGKFTFVVDERYFRIKDLARLGLARIAHETDHYDNAYYHYFQIPEDSDKLGDALFEAAWSMYQKRELPASRELLKDFISQFPGSHLVPEARLLAGYVDLADCEFKDAQKHYDNLVKDLGPIVKHIDTLRKSPEKRGQLLDKALKRWREERAEPDEQVQSRLKTNGDKVLALLRFDEKFVRVHEAVAGLRRAAGNAPHVTRSWTALSKRFSQVKVRGNSEEESAEETDARDGQALVADLERLHDEIAASRATVQRALREENISKEEAEEERKRLKAIDDDISKLEERAVRAAEAAAIGEDEGTPEGLKPLINTDIKESKKLEADAKELLGRLETRANSMAKDSLEKLYIETRRVLDKAKLGKIDSVIGQKRQLEIEVQDLASGRFPPELHGHLWEQGLIGDDEEYWPFEGEYWADEYEGWR
jgi:TolA-binding protein